jgi:uncharacterized ubiquitin-like protein YukD
MKEMIKAILQVEKKELLEFNFNAHEIKIISKDKHIGKNRRMYKCIILQIFLLIIKKAA